VEFLQPECLQAQCLQVQCLHPDQECLLQDLFLSQLSLLQQFPLPLFLSWIPHVLLRLSVPP